MLSYPFTLFWILAHTFFFGVTIFWCYHCVWLHYTIHQGPYTKVHTPSYFRGFKCPYTCLFLYRKKLQMSTFLVYLYKKKRLRASKGPYTSVHQILFGPLTSCVMCYHSVLITLSSFQRSVEDSNVRTPVYFYIEKNSKCPLFWYTYIRKKPFRALKHTNTWIHQILCSNSMLRFWPPILCSNSVLPVLSFSSF